MPITRETILAALRGMAEPAYAAFAASLLPAGTPVLGVRLPALRRYARTLARMLPDTPALWQALGGPYLNSGCSGVWSSARPTFRTLSAAPG